MHMGPQENPSGGNGFAIVDPEIVEGFLAPAVMQSGDRREPLLAGRVDVLFHGPGGGLHDLLDLANGDGLHWQAATLRAIARARGRGECEGGQEDQAKAQVDQRHLPEDANIE